MRIKNSIYLEKKLKNFKSLNFKIRYKNLKEVFHLYEIRVNNFKIRNKLVNYLRLKGTDAKIHYPIPMHLQPAAKFLKYKKGDFPITEDICKTVISLPVHEFITQPQRKFVVKKIKDFYTKS